MERFGKKMVIEGKHWPEDYKKTALNMIKTSPLGQTSWYSDSYQKKDVDTIADEFGSLSHKNSNLGYFSPIIKWFLEYAGNDPKKYQEFIETKLDGIIQTLLYISNNPGEESKVKDALKTKWAFSDFEEFQKEIQSKIDAQQKEKSKNLSLQDKGYEIIPINSYEELHEKFGGDKTGYKGQSEWCHSNGKSTYSSWTNNGSRMFFVLAKKGWKEIKPPEPKTTNAYDEYGTSLIAILVSVISNKLLNATLRWNHIMEPSKTIPGTSVDKAFLGWADLAEVTGRNVEHEIAELNANLEKRMKSKMETANKKVETILKNKSVAMYGVFSEKLKPLITKIEIPNNVSVIGSAFSHCENLKFVTIPNSVESIGNNAFDSCISIESITIPNSVKSLGSYAFFRCSSLKSITIPSSINFIDILAFKDCTSLSSAIIEEGPDVIGFQAFFGCKNLVEVKLPKSISSIEKMAFGDVNPNIVFTVPKHFDRSLFWQADIPKTAKFRVIE